MEIQVTIPEWLKLPQPVRSRMVQIFEIPRSTGSQMESSPDGGVLISDGHTHKDLSAITVEKMQVFLDEHDDKDFVSLFNKVIAKLEEEKVEPKPEVQTREQMLLEEWSMALGRFKSQAVFFKLETEFEELIRKITNVTERLPRVKRGPKKAKAD